MINYEEGAENSVLHGDAGSEAFLSEMVGAASHPARAMAMESLYEYGSRAGFWRLHRLFTARRLPVTVFGVATALAANPAAVEAMHAAGWGDRQPRPALDRLSARLRGDRAPAHHRRGRASHGGDRPPPARLVPGANVAEHRAPRRRGRRLRLRRRQLCRRPALLGPPHGRAQLIVPYSLDANDMKFVALNGFADGEPFFRYLRDTFDALVAEAGG